MKNTILIPFDFETTSNQPSSTRAVQLAAHAITIPRDGNPFAAEVQRDIIFHDYLNPGGISISDGAFEIHGITDAMVANAMLDEEASKLLYQFLLDHPDDELILAGHFITTFDVPILVRLAGQATLPENVKVLDSYTCVSRCFPRMMSKKLADTVKNLGLSDGEGAHDALADITFVQLILNHIYHGMKGEKQWTIGEMADWAMTPRVLTTCSFGKHIGKPYGKGEGCVPSGYISFICGAFEDPHPDLEATVLHHYGKRFWKKKASPIHRASVKGD